MILELNEKKKGEQNKTWQCYLNIILWHSCSPLMPFSGDVNFDWYRFMWTKMRWNAFAVDFEGCLLKTPNCCSLQYMCFKEVLLPVPESSIALESFVRSFDNICSKRQPQKQQKIVLYVGKSCPKHTTCKHYLLDVCQPNGKLYSCTWFSSLSSRISMSCLFILSCISEFIVISCPIAASCSTILVSWYWMTFSSWCILSAKSWK